MLDAEDTAPIWYGLPGCWMLMPPYGLVHPPGFKKQNMQKTHVSKTTRTKTSAKHIVHCFSILMVVANLPEPLGT